METRQAAATEAVANIQKRLGRIEGQVRGIQRMVDEGRPCAEVLTQLLAARAALERVAEQVIATHVDECLASMEPAQARDSLSQAIRLLARVHS